MNLLCCVARSSELFSCIFGLILGKNKLKYNFTYQISSLFPVSRSVIIRELVYLKTSGGKDIFIDQKYGIGWTNFKMRVNQPS
jgi:hypothetical protein